MTDRADPAGYRGVLFDLFGTLVHFKLAAAGAARRSPVVSPLLAQAIAEVDAGIALADFVDALRAVTLEIADQRRQSHAECSSVERFRRTLRRLGIDDRAKAQRLCEAHMAAIADAAEMPPEHAGLLRGLRGSLRLGLVSNFDHAPTARSILRRFGIEALFDHVVISDECGWRKPGRRIFDLAVAAMGMSNRELVFVGDSALEDVDGARRAGIDAVWLNPAGDVFPPDLLAPTRIATSLADFCASVRP